MMHGGGWDGMGAWGWFGMTLMLVFWFGLIALLIVALTGGWPRRNQGSVEAPSGADPALTVLRERFARGEITAEEYRRVQAVLTEGIDRSDRTEAER
jgi:putative membrane protein